ncbi:MAG: hypothetical protein L6R48_24950, partial [Planctomycetes bacterium]|nr:hypothetical protein [Planctomycetota bacterium]
MTFAADLLRALAIDALALAGAAVVLAIPRRRLVAVVLALWWCVPAVAVAWGWSRWALPLAGNTGLHLALAALHLVPLAAGLASALPPPPLDRAGLHLLRLAGVAAPRRWWAWCVWGAGRRWLFTAGLALPLAFAEFELASRLAVPAWSVRLFDAQAGGVDPGATLAIALPGMAAQAAALALAWGLAWAGGRAAPPAPRPGWAWAGWTVLAAGSLALVGVPLGLIAAEAGAGSITALVDGGLWRECAATAGYAA